MGDASEASKRAREGSPRQGGAPSPQRARVADDAVGDAAAAPAPAAAPLAAALSAPPAPATAATGDGHHGHAPHGPHGAHSAPASGAPHHDDAPPPPPRSLLEQALDDVAPSLHLDFAEYEHVGQLGVGGFGKVLHMRRRGREPGAPAGIAVAVKQALGDDVADALSYEEELVKELLVYRRLGCPSDEEGWCVRCANPAPGRPRPCGTCARTRAAARRQPGATRALTHTHVLTCGTVRARSLTLRCPQHRCPLVRFLGLFTSPRLGLVLEMYGTSLHKVLFQQPPDFGSAARRTVARHVAQACRFLHEARAEGLATNGIVHRDVKPANVLVDATKGYAAKLTDFGTSRLMSVLALNCTMKRPAGTHAYMAPEVLNGSATKEQAPKVDVYAYGILLYELYSGKPPNSWYRQLESYREAFDNTGDALSGLMRVVLGGERPSLEGVGTQPGVRFSVPARVAALVPRCVAASPGERPTFRDICGALQRTRARLTVRYSPSLARGAACEVHIALRMDDAASALDGEEAAPSEAPSETAAAPVDDGMTCFDFIVPAREGDTCVIRLAPVASADAWMGSTTVVLGDALPPLAPGPAPLRSATLTVQPDWGQCPEAGHRSALKITWERRSVVPPSGPVPHAGTAAGSPLQPPPGGTPRSLSSSLGSLALRLAGERSLRTRWPSTKAVRRAAAVDNPDIFVSYRDVETGRMGNRFSLDELQPALEREGYSVFCYALQLRAGDAWVSVLTDGIEKAKAFIPVCSPTYADLSSSPWTSNELFHASRTAELRAEAAAAAAAKGLSKDDGGAAAADVAAAQAPPPPARPFLLPLWHSGIFPPPDTAAILGPLAARRVPAGPTSADAIIARGDLSAVIQELVAALKAAGVHPSRGAA
jgi:serine/threonine protein kinase